MSTPPSQSYMSNADIHNQQKGMKKARDAGRRKHREMREMHKALLEEMENFIYALQIEYHFEDEDFLYGKYFEVLQQWESDPTHVDDVVHILKRIVELSEMYENMLDEYSKDMLLQVHTMTYNALQKYEHLIYPSVVTRTDTNTASGWWNSTSSNV